jgi:hypothetical protein
MIKNETIIICLNINHFSNSSINLVKCANQRRDRQRYFENVSLSVLKIGKVNAEQIVGSNFGMDDFSTLVFSSEITLEIECL